MVWQTTTLGNIAEIKAGGTPSRKNAEFWQGGTIPWIKISDIKGMYVENSEEKITTEGLHNSSAKLFNKGTILFTIFATLGEVAILNIDAATNQAIAGITVTDDNINSKFLFYYLEKQKKDIQLKGRGVAQNNINLSILKELSIPIPPLEIQKKIADVLDKAQELIDKRKKQIELLDEFLQSVFIDMFGDPVTNPKEWEISTLGEIGMLQRGTSRHRPRNAPELLGGPYPLIQTGDVANSGLYIKQYSQTYSELGLQQSKIWPAGTLCITIAANIAETGILKFNACFPDSVVAYLPNDNMNNNYVQFWFMFLQSIIEKNAPESAQKNINLQILKQLSIPVPPLNLQNKFAEIVQATEEQRELMEKSLEEMENNFNSISQKAFRGELFS